MNKHFVYRTSLVLNSAAALAGAGANLGRNKTLVEGFRRLGYPPYLATLLGACEALGAVALLVPGRPTLKEWAFAGFTFTYAGAFFSHLASSEKKESLAPLASLTLLLVCYATRPERDTVGPVV